MKKHRRLCKFLAVLLVFVMIVNNVHAYRNDEKLYTDEQINRITGAIQQMYDIDCDYVYAARAESEDTIADFIYTDDKMLGVYVTDKQTGMESFIFDDSPVLYEMIRKGEAKVSLKGEICVRSGDDVYPIVYAEKASDHSGMAETGIVSETGEDYEVISAGVAVYLSNMASQGYFINMPIIENDINPYDDYSGLCWAACGASITNHYRPSSYQAISMCCAVYNKIGYCPVGNEYCQKTMYSQVSQLSYVYYGGKLTYAIVTSSLAGGSPIVINVERTSDATGHAVIICGSIHISTSYGYIYMDPNVASGYVLNYQAFSVLSSSSNPFYYYAGGPIKYDSMYRSFRSFHTL
ncbi:MAG: hypothetical protein K5848_02750 [Lachnospiraceae bacterium]|nr:hypothetical protein [Lachnospiraceae bacterium]